VRYTNKYNLPDYVVEFLESDLYDYEEGVISATRLLTPARQFVLNHRFKDELEMDISDIIPSRYGTAIHELVSGVKLTNCLQEQRLYTDIEVNGKVYKLSGKFDIIKDMDKPVRKLVDIKSTSVWSYIYDSKTKDYITQLSIYRYLANKNGLNVGKDAEIMMVFTDWSRKRSESSSNYPETRIKIKEIKLWSESETEEYIKFRLGLFDKCLDMDESELPDCNDEELWRDKPKYEVVIKDRVVKTCSSEEKAKQHIKKYKLDAKINIKKGDAKRCEYCTVRKFCSQYIKLKEEQQQL